MNDKKMNTVNWQGGDEITRSWRVSPVRVRERVEPHPTPIKESEGK